MSIAVVMNIIGHRTAYSLYPMGTFEERRALQCIIKQTYGVEEALEKYRKRGWEIVDHVSDHEIVHHRNFKSGKRWVGDPICWSILLPDPSGTSSSPLESFGGFPDDTLPIHSWHLEYVSNQAQMACLTISLNPRLKFSYVTVQKSDVLRAIRCARDQRKMRL